MNLVLLPVRRCVLAGVLVLGSIGPSSAHDVWLTLSGPSAERRVIINYGHPDDRPPALADKVVDIIEITAGARRSLLNGLEAATENGFTVARTKPFADGGTLCSQRATTMASGSRTLTDSTAMPRGGSCQAAPIAFGPANSPRR